VFSFLRRKPSSPAPLTFNERVDAFWSWFHTQAPRFRDTINAGKCATLADEISPRIDELLPGFSWVFGKGTEPGKHSFTLSGEGVIHRQLLALQWLARAPSIEHWTFHAARQAGPISGHVIELDELRIDPKAIWVTPSIDTEGERVDLTVWHPEWERIDASRRTTITFLFLDEALGEYGTGWWIGAIEFGKHKLAQSFPLEELPGFTAKLAADKGWKKYPPGGVWTLYRTRESQGDFPRADVLTQNTCVPRLFVDFMESAGDYEDPIKGTGADYVYLSLDKAHLPEGGEIARRGEIEDAIDAALTRTQSGRFIGGAMGRERAYCDVLIFDGQRSLDTLRLVLREQGVNEGTTIEYFAREKQSLASRC